MQHSSLFSPADSEKRPLTQHPYALSLGIILLASLVGLPLRPFIEPTNLVMLYLLAVVIVALRYGRTPAVVASLLSVLCFNVLFVPPYYRLVVADTQYLLTFIALLIVGITVSTLTAEARNQTRAAHRREGETVALYSLSRALAVAAETDEVCRVVVAEIEKLLQHRAALFLADDSGELRLRAKTAAWQPKQAQLAEAKHVYAHQDGSMAIARMLYLPIAVGPHRLGTLAIHSLAPGTTYSPAQRRLLDSFAHQTALALERAQLAEQASEALVLRETERLQSALLNSISHDLRTPLATITGTLSTLYDDDALLDERARRLMLETAVAEAERLNLLVSNLLDIAQLEAGALRLMEQVNDVQDLVGVTLAQLGSRLRNREIQLSIPADLPPVRMDLRLMTQALVNLVDNALKYAPEEKPITISAEEQEGEVVIAVTDEGVGLSPRDIPYIFDKFYRAGQTGDTHPGSGLGLAIVKGIVEAHHGRCWADEAAGGGTTMSIALDAHWEEMNGHE